MLVCQRAKIHNNGQTQIAKNPASSKSRQRMCHSFRTLNDMYETFSYMVCDYIWKYRGKQSSLAYAFKMLIFALVRSYTLSGW